MRSPTFRSARPGWPASGSSGRDSATSRPRPSWSSPVMNAPFVAAAQENDLARRQAVGERPLLADIVEEVGECSFWLEASRFGDEVGSVSCRPSGRPYGRYAAIAGESAFIGLSRASRLRFWAVAARFLARRAGV